MSKAIAETKVCGGCAEEKAITAYYRLKDGRLPHICKACDLASAKQRMKERNDTLDGRLYSKFNDARKAVRKSGTTVNTLTLADVEQAYRHAVSAGCPYCGGIIEESDFSLDHIIPLSRGGTNEQANVIICHTGCNSRKNTWPAADYVDDVDVLTSYIWPRMERPLPLDEVRRMLAEGERQEETET